MDALAILQGALSTKQSGREKGHFEWDWRSSDLGHVFLVRESCLIIQYLFHLPLNWPKAERGSIRMPTFRRNPAMTWPHNLIRSRLGYFTLPGRNGCNDQLLLKLWKVVLVPFQKTSRILLDTCGATVARALPLAGFTCKAELNKKHLNEELVGN